MADTLPNMNILPYGGYDPPLPRALPNGVYVHVTPSNYLAEVAFSGSYRFAQRDDPERLVNMETTEEDTVDAPPGSPTKYDNIPATTNLYKGTQRGRYTLSFDKSRGPKSHSEGYSMGRGTEDKEQYIDLFLSRPGDAAGSSLTGLPCVLKMHPKCGLLQFCSPVPSGDRYPEVEVEIQGRMRKLWSRDTVLLWQISTQVKIGKLAYKITYSIDETTREDFIRRRAEYIRTYCDLHSLLTQFMYVPGDPAEICGKTARFYTIGCGAFGWVILGLNLETGLLLAIKEVRLTNPNQREALKTEIHIGKLAIVSHFDFFYNLLLY